jgi:hypothetical protein
MAMFSMTMFSMATSSTAVADRRDRRKRTTERALRSITSVRLTARTHAHRLRDDVRASACGVSATRPRYTHARSPRSSHRR